MGNVILKNSFDKVKYVQFLHDASEIKFRSGGESKNDVIMSLPVLKPGVEIPVLEVYLK